MQWNQIEKRTLSPKRVIGKRRVSAIPSCGGATTIPDEVKDFYIKKFILMRVREYIHELRSHKSECKKLTHIFERRRGSLEIEAWGEKIELRVVLPPPPKKNYSIGLEDYRQLIKEALSDRTLWESIIKYSEYRRSFSVYS